MEKQVNTKTIDGSGSTGPAPRMAGPEMLRCLAMMMVVVLHFLDKGKFLGNLSAPEMTSVGCFAWLLESFAISAVNLYMLLSGYFLCESSFKLSRLLQLLIQLWTYSVGVGLLSILLGIYPLQSVNTHFLLTLLFPVSQEHYWFVRAYLYLYLLLPLIGGVVRRMEKKPHRLTIFLFLMMLCVPKSIMPFKFDFDGRGYDCFWYLCLFLVAAYIRKFGLPVLSKKITGLALYVLASLGIFGLTFALRTVYLKSGSLKLLLGIAYDYNHVLVFLASLGLFMVFIGIRGRNGLISRFASRIGRYTLGVYLLHENLGVRYIWPGWLGAHLETTTPAVLCLRVFAAVEIVFFVGILVEFLRSTLMKGLHALMMHVRPYSALMEKINIADAYFSEKRADQK